MDILVAIVAFSTVIWYIVDRAKDSFWSGRTYSKWLTLGVALLLSIGCVLCFNLDLIFALGVYNSITIMGKILTILILASGSSGISEIIQRIRGK